MQPAVYETTSVKVTAESISLRWPFPPKVKFDSFMSVYVQEDEKEENNVLAEKLEKGWH